MNSNFDPAFQYHCVLFRSKLQVDLREMPKQPAPIATKLTNFVKSFGDDVFSTDGSILFCKICETSVNHDKKYFVTQHIGSGKHSSLAARRAKGQMSTSTSLLKSCFEAAGKQSQFSLELCNAFVSSSIPLWKLENPVLKDFLQKYTKENVPSESSIRKNYIDVVYNQRIDSIRKAVGDHYVWCSIDETTDVTGRYVVNFIVGTLNSENSQIFLLLSDVVEATNSSTIAQVFTKALTVLWPSGIRHSRVLLLVTDAAPYMIKAGRALKVLFPSMLHVTCLAHAFHRVAEEVRRKFPDVDKLIANGKKVFRKAPKRVQTFKSIVPDTALPPEPIVTRWGKWISSALYYAKHFEEFKSVMNALCSTEAVSIEITKQIMEKPSLKNDLAFILTHFHDFPERITALEKRDVPLSASLSKVDHLHAKLISIPGPIGEAIQEKFLKVIDQNPDLDSIRKISAALSGTSMTDCDLSPSALASMKFAPLTSVDVERSFSQLKHLLSDRRQSLAVENISKMLIIACNQ